MRHLGQTIAPPRFLMFVVAFALTLAVAIPWLGTNRGIMAAFDTAALVFIAAVGTLFRRGEAARMRAVARRNDANRVLLLGLTAAVMLVVLVAVHGEVTASGDKPTVALVIATLALAWLFSNLVYALHYAHLFYLDADGEDAGGLDFPDTKEPDYWDFWYFSCTLGMTFQTSDVSICARDMRVVVTFHSLAAFVFNLGVLAFTINVLGGG